VVVVEEFLALLLLLVVRELLTKVLLAVAVRVEAHPTLTALVVAVVALEQWA
jgi:hypothetical protein